ncbi:Histone acetyltransferase type B subunit 2 [Spathaspora sp. JA1]|nr:Histone acetyltransferase type B subunit 2 [Spathaspora sp. JA1]
MSESLNQLEDIEQEESGELTIKQEYQLWRKNCRYMYEFVSETALTWPSLTIQWLPEYTSNNGIIDGKLLIGTNTSGEDKNYLKVATTQLPESNSQVKVNTRLKIIQKFENNAEICRARFMLQNSNIVATINGLGEIVLYDLKGDSKQATLHNNVIHSENGYGLSWNPFTKGYLLTGADDKICSVLDTNTNKAVFKSDIQQDIVNDVKWHNFDENLFASVSEDCHVYLFDIRTNSNVSKFHAKGSNGINTIAFSPFSRNLISIGNTNSNINLLDLRNLSTSGDSGLLHTMMGHGEAITSMEFDPFHDGILATGAQDRRVILWDLSKIGEEQQQEDAEDGCPELFMMHAGHTGSVTDLNWCPFKPWTLGTVADDNIVHIWEVGSNLRDSEENNSIDPNDLE